MEWKGITYPLESGEYGVFNTAVDEELIQGNIIQILGTYRGERVMLPLFGSRIRDYIHDPADDVTLRLLRVEIIDAIKMWEPRVFLKSASLRMIPEDFSVFVNLEYALKDTGEGRSFSLVIDNKGGVKQWQG